MAPDQGRPCPPSRPLTPKHVVYTVLSVVFNAMIIAVALQGRAFSVSPWQWALLVLATFRISRLISFDIVMETYRSPFVRTTLHESGAGETTCVRDDVGYIRQAIGELIVCPICNGTWVAAFLTIGLIFLPVYTTWLIGIMAIIGASEFVFAAFESIQWVGELARHANGRVIRNREE